MIGKMMLATQKILTHNVETIIRYKHINGICSDNTLCSDIAVMCNSRTANLL